MMNLEWLLYFWSSRNVTRKTLNKFKCDSGKEKSWLEWKFYEKPNKFSKKPLTLRNQSSIILYAA